MWKASDFFSAECFKRGRKNVCCQKCDEYLKQIYNLYFWAGVWCWLCYLACVSFYYPSQISQERWDWWMCTGLLFNLPLNCVWPACACGVLVLGQSVDRWGGRGQTADAGGVGRFSGAATQQADTFQRLLRSSLRTSTLLFCKNP